MFLELTIDKASRIWEHLQHKVNEYGIQNEGVSTE